jgi:hypothetical protein
MTNYERIQQDKAFCAAMFCDIIEEEEIECFVQWLDAEQREVSDEREQEGKSGTDASKPV